MKKKRCCYLFFFLLILSLSASNCKKVKEEIGMKFIIGAMTDGRWVVQVFTENNIDLTADFNGFEFQFTEEGKVYAIKAPPVENVNGTWKGDVNNLTIYSNFPGVGDPLMKLNDTWKITNNTTKLVEAKPFNSNRTAYLKLVKKV